MTEGRSEYATRPDFPCRKGIEAPRVEVDMAAGENQRPEYLAKNPMGYNAAARTGRWNDDRRINCDLSLFRNFASRSAPVWCRRFGAGQGRDVEQAHGDRTHATSCGPFHSPVAVLERPTGTDCPGRACRARASGSPYALARRRIVRPGFHCR